MYLDPGFGGMLVQALVAIAAVGGAIVYSFRKKIRDLFSGKKDDAGDAAEGTKNQQEYFKTREDDVIDTLDEK